MDKIESKNYSRKNAWFSLALALFMVVNSFATALISHSFPHFLIGVGFAFFGIAWFKDPIKFNKPVAEILTDQDVDVGKKVVLLNITGFILIIVGYLFHWTN